MWLQGTICPAAQYQYCHMGTAKGKINNKPFSQRDKYNWLLLVFTTKSWWFPLLASESSSVEYLLSTKKRIWSSLINYLKIGKQSNILESSSL